MLISETATLRWNSKIKKHYVNLGYEFTRMKDEFEVKVCDLTKGSSALITVKCDYCGKLYDIKWQTYLRLSRDIIQNDACADCCEIKAKNSIEAKYGDYHNLYLSTNEKRIDTNYKKFGHSNPFANENVKNKIKQFYIGNYGVEYNMQINDCVKKAKQTCMERYGVDHYSKTSEWRESHRGENSPVWKGDLATTVRDGRELPEYRDWRKAVFDRDLYTCQCCGARNGYGKYIRLESHHIKNWKDNPEYRYDVDNGITLCMNCHLLFHSKYGKNNNNENQLIEFMEEYTIDKNIC